MGTRVAPAACRGLCAALLFTALLPWGVARAAVPTVVVYDNLASPTDLTFFGGQNGEEPRDDLHGVAAGPLYRITFDYDDPSSATDSISATVSVYGNPGGNDIGTPLAWGPHTVTGLPRGRHRVTVTTNAHPMVGPHLWVGVRFSSTTAGLVLHDPPAAGSSHDYFNENGGLFNFLGNPPANFSIRVEAVQCPAPAILYVNAGASGANDGSSWTNAFTNLEDALALAACGAPGEVWVAAGTYRPRVAIVVDFEDGPPIALNDFLYSDPVDSRGYRMNAPGGGLEWDADGAYNGTRSYFMDNIVGTLTRVDGGTFTPRSFRAGEDIDFVARTITVTGFFASGGQADTTYDIDGIGDGPGGVDDYQTFVLPASFTELVSLRFEDPAGQMALDDVVIDGPSVAYATFPLPAGVGVFGGFAGTETARSERDWVAHVTVLSGDVGTAGDPADNVRHVVTAGPGAHLDGFTVIGGNAGTLPGDTGGGIVSTGGGSQAFEHLVVTGNSAGQGGGVAAAGGALTFTDVVFSGNTAGSGGALHSTGGAPQLRDVTFENNTATGGSGGAVFNSAGAMAIAGAVFHGNSAAASGGALFNQSGGTTLTSASFHGNVAGAGGSAIQLTGAGGTTEIWNTILWGGLGGAEVSVSGAPQPVFRNSIVQGSGGSGAGWDPGLGVDGGGNLDQDPEFVDGPNGNLRLAETSPARDAGDGGAPNLPAYDLDGADRILGAAVDIGAYELPPATVSVDDSAAVFAAGLRLTPNPLRGAGTITFVARKGERTTVELFDLHGRRVRTLFDGRTEETGIRRLAFQPRVAGGVYFLRLTSGGERRTSRVVLLR